MHACDHKRYVEVCVSHFLQKNQSYLLMNLHIVGVDINTDVRVSSMKLLNSLGVADLVTMLYPRLYCVSDMKDDEGISNLRGEVKLPPMVRTSYERLNPTGAYLLGNKSIWIHMCT